MNEMIREWREQIGVRVMMATKCTHEGDDFGPRAVCVTCFENTQRIGAIVEAEVQRERAGRSDLPDLAGDDLRDDLARTIWIASRADEGTISAAGANVIADALLASASLARLLAQPAANPTPNGDPA